MKFVLTASALIAVLIAVAIQPQHPLPSLQVNGSIKGVDDADKAVRTLAAFTALRTLSDRLAPNHVPDAAPFHAAHDLLRKSFPKVFSELAVEVVSDLSLLFKWEGSNAALKPMLMMAHIDVVPADESNTSLWTHPPFGGVIAGDGYIYGRGAMDIKCMLTAELEAVEQLLTDGFKPDRTVYLAFGHDEEVGGSFGAAAIAGLLQSRGVQLEFVLDEGGIVLADGVKPFVADPVAIVGTAEKGFSLTEVHLKSPGGHSAMPPVKPTSIASMIGRLFAAIDKQPTPLTMVNPMPDFFAALASGARYRGLAWLLRHADHPLISRALALALSRRPDTAALVRTTLATTRMAAGVADNVLPQTGILTFNARHLPGQGPDFVKEYLLARLGADQQNAAVKLLDDGHRAEASVVSPPDGPAFQRIATAARATMGIEGLVVAPYLVVGGTDSKHYSALTDNIYRFQPVAYSISKGDLKRIHGTDERLSRDAYLKSISFFMLVISSGDPPAADQR